MNAVLEFIEAHEIWLVPLGIAVAVFAVFEVIRAARKSMRADMHFWQPPHALPPAPPAAGGGAPAPVIVGFQHGYFWPSLLILLLAAGVVIAALVYKVPPVASGASTSSGSGVTTLAAPVTDAEVQAALQRLVNAVRRGEIHAKEAKLTAGFRPFFLRIPKKRLAPAEVPLLQSQAQNVIDTYEPGTKITDIVEVTFRGDSAATKVIGAYVWAEVEVEKTDAMGAKTKVKEHRNVPFSAPSFLDSNQETKDWAEAVALQEEMLIPTTGGLGTTSGMTGALPPVPVLSIPSPVQVAPAPSK